MGKTMPNTIHTALALLASISTASADRQIFNMDSGLFWLAIVMAIIVIIIVLAAIVVTMMRLSSADKIKPMCPSCGTPVSGMEYCPNCNLKIR